MMTQHSINEKTLPELKMLALDELGLTREQVKQHGDLRQRATWLNAIAQAYKDGFTTKAYQELPIIQATQENTAVNDSVQNRSPVADNELVELSAVPYLDDPNAIAQIEPLITRKHTHNLLVKPSNLEQLRRHEAKFCCYQDWMHPGKIVEVYPIGLCQILFIDLNGIIYYIAFKNNQTHRQYLFSFVERAMSTQFTHQESIEYINKLYLNLSCGGITPTIV